MSELPPLTGKEEIGRAVWDSKKAKQAATGNIHWKIFREKDGVRDLSVDRVSYGGLATLAICHGEERTNQQFHGWAVVSVDRALRMGRSVQPDPIAPTNAYHALIILPEAAEQEFVDAQYEHALDLAMAARWLARP